MNSMSLTLFYHPLSSFCQKALVALYENATPFAGRIVNLMDPAERAEYLQVWPIGKFPVLRDEARKVTIPESSAIIAYLAEHYPGPAKLIPAGGEAWRMHLWDHVHDLYLNVNVGKIVTDKLRPERKNDPFGVAQATEQLGVALGIVDREMEGKTWALGDAFTMADCAAAPSLFYADMLMPFAETHRHAAAYLGRLKKRPSFARVLDEAKPYLAMMPK